jgi:polyphosphate glucokinase
MEILGIDIGGSGIKGAIVNIETGELLTERIRIETPQPATPLAVAETIAQLANQLSWKGLIGCGFPAVIQHGVAKTASNVDASWIGTDAEKIFSQVTNCKCKVLNDADAAGLAEIKFGVGKGIYGVILLITVGTGIGSALFNDQQLVPNTEYGHFYLQGQIAEKFCADSIRKKLDLTWENWAMRFNLYLEHLEKVCRPDIIILGGGVSKKREKFMPYISLNTEIKIAQLENNAGIVGAALGATIHI